MSIYYENLPHWHGILINDGILFMGRTDWNFPDPELEKLPYFLYVGQAEYRLFRKDDFTGGGGRIKRFISWFNYYKISALRKSKEE